MKNNATFHLSSIHFDWRAFFMSLTSIWKEKKNICDEIRCFNKLRHSWCSFKSTCSILSTGVEYGFYTTLISTDFTNWGDLLSCIRWPLTAASPQSLTSIVIECTARPSKLFKLQLLQARQELLAEWALCPCTSCCTYTWHKSTELLTMSTGSWGAKPIVSPYRDGSCCREGGCLLHPSSLRPGTLRALMDVQTCGERMWLKPSSGLVVHLAPLTDTGNPEAGVLGLFKHTRSAQLRHIIKAVFFSTGTESCATLWLSEHS